MNVEEYENIYWKNFLIIKESFENCLKYVTLDKMHDDVYSNEFLNIILRTGVELESAFKEFSPSTPSYQTISDYCREAINKFPNIINEEVEVINYGIIKPFDSWDASKARTSLPFWDAYDNIKHNRILNYKDANLKNALYGVSALFMVELLRLDDLFSSNPNDSSNTPNNDASDLMILVNHKYRTRPSKVAPPYDIVNEDEGVVLLKGKR